MSMSSNPDIRPDFRHLQRVATYVVPFALGIHVCYVGLFWYLGETGLALFNIGSVALYAGLILLLRAGHILTVSALTLVEVYVHASLCVLLVGWDFGFQYFVLVTVGAIFLIPSRGGWTRLVRPAVALTALALFLYLQQLGKQVPSRWPALVVELVNAANITGMCLILALQSYHFRRSAIHAERALELKNEQLQQTMAQLEEARDRLVLREKMASLGKLVAGVAHELNTPLSAINSAQNTLKHATQKLADGAGAAPHEATTERVLKTINETRAVLEAGVARVNQVISSLKNFARLDESEYQVVDIHEGIESLLTLQASQLFDGCTVTKEFARLDPFLCAPGQLNQAFLIVLQYVRLWSAEPVTIHIRTFAQAELACINFESKNTQLEPEQLSAFFDFSFDSSGSRVHLDLGLPTAYNIVKDHGGELRYQHSGGAKGGISVTVVLPMNRKPSVSSRPPPAADSPLEPNRAANRDASKDEHTRR